MFTCDADFNQSFNQKREKRKKNTTKTTKWSVLLQMFDVCVVWYARVCVFKSWYRIISHVNVKSLSVSWILKCCSTSTSANVFFFCTRLFKNEGIFNVSKIPLAFFLFFVVVALHPVDHDKSILRWTSHKCTIKRMFSLQINSCRAPYFFAVNQL